MLNHALPAFAIASLLAFGAGVAPAGAEVVTTRSEAAVVPLDYDVKGFAEVKTGIRGRVTIAGTFSGAYTPATGAFTGAFALTPTRAHVTVLGLLPVVAETDWSFTEPVTGRWQDGVLTLHAAARIHHPRLLAFGSIPVAGGGKCATRRPSILDLQSDPATPTADVFGGGTLKTTGNGFTISPLSGCGALDGLLSAVAAGGGNQATLQLSPRSAG